MKSSDLKVGTEYVCKWRSYSTPEKVTVLEVGVTAQTRVGFRDETRKGLVKVEFAGTGRTENVRPQTLMGTWEQHLAQKKETKKARAVATRRDNAERRRKAEVAFGLHQRLVAAGAPVGTETVYRDAEYYALVEAGFVPVPEGVIGRSTLFSALSGLSSAMDGDVSLDDAAVLAGLAEPKVTKYSGLDAWDWDYIRAEQGDEVVDEVFAAYAEASKVGV